VFGPTGIGKSHLLCGLAHVWSTTDPWHLLSLPTVGDSRWARQSSGLAQRAHRSRLHDWHYRLSDARDLAFTGDEVDIELTRIAKPST
jgi:ABC-type cobalamin transport system ATPase subunit